VILALAVSAALAVNIQQDFQQQKQPSAEASHLVAHKKQKPEKFVYVSEPVREEGGGLIESGLSGLLSVIGLPKKVLGAVVGFAYGKIRSMGVKNLLKTALVAGLITVLGAVAAVVAVSVAGLVSVVSGLCAAAFYFVGGGGGANGGGHGNGDAYGQASESRMDSITDFVMTAFDKYESLDKA
jgi:hypothetical protein